MSKNKNNNGPAKKDEVVVDKKSEDLYCKRCSKQFGQKGKLTACPNCKKDDQVVLYSDFLKVKDPKTVNGKSAGKPDSSKGGKQEPVKGGDKKGNDKNDKKGGKKK